MRCHSQTRVNHDLTSTMTVFVVERLQLVTEMALSLLGYCYRKTYDYSKLLDHVVAVDPILSTFFRHFHRVRHRLITNMV